MRLPGFAAESTLYRTSVHYKTVLLRGQLPVALIGPFPNVLCQPCSLDQSQCTQYCVHCPTPIPDERCWAAFTPCAPSECCPSGQNPCYVSGKSKFCCPPEQLCCNPETNVLLPTQVLVLRPGEQSLLPSGTGVFLWRLLPNSRRPRSLSSHRKNRQLKLFLFEQLPAHYGSHPLFDSHGRYQFE